MVISTKSIQLEEEKRFALEVVSMLILRREMLKKMDLIIEPISMFIHFWNMNLIRVTGKLT